MYQCRKFTRRNLLFLLTIGVVYLLLDHYFNGEDYGDNREKL